jgi:hypothetical protein
MAIERKSFKAELLSFNDKALTLEHFISTETEDSGKDIMLADGMEKRGNVVVLFQHGLDPKFGNEPIAKVLDIRTGNNKAGAKGLIAKTQYFNGANLTPPDNTGERLYQKAKTGVMPNWSIGFESLIETPTSNGGRIVKKWLLHEYSQVAIGMNAEATTELGATAPEVKFGVIFKREGEAEQNAAPEAKGSHMSGKASANIAHKAMHALHKGMIEDMKAAATATGFDPVQAEKCAKELLTGFSESIEPHVQKYIKAMIQTPDIEDDALPVPEADSDENKILSEVGHKIAHKALKMTHKAMIEDIYACKGKTDIDHKAKATELIDAHEKAALPHATAFVKAWAEKCSKSVLPMEHKSIAERTSYQICCNALETIFRGMIWEATGRAWTDKEPNAEAICGDACSEAVELFAPYLKWLIEDAISNRTDLAEPTVEAKDTAQKNFKNNLSKYLEAKNIPTIPVVVDMSTPQKQGNTTPPAMFKIFAPQPQQIKVAAPEGPAKIKVIAPEEKPTSKGSFKMTGADIDRIAAAVKVNMQNVFKAELNRQKGRIE